MTQNIINSLFLAGVFSVLFAAAELLYHKCNVKVEYSRKFVHLTSGLATLAFPLMLSNQWFVLALCAGFALVLAISQQFNWLPSINAIDRVSYGSILYPGVVFGAYMAHLKFGSLLFFYLPILILAICDPLACLAGKKWPKGKYTILDETKTLVGSAAFFVAASCVSISLFVCFTELPFQSIVFNSLAIAFGTTAAEGLSQKGYDNLFIPLAAIAILSFLALQPLAFA